MRMTRPLLTGGLATLIRALTKRAGAQPIVEDAQSRPWSSITFTGARHRFSLRYDGDEAASHAHALVDGLDYAEFDLGAHILVDIAVLENCRNAKSCTITVEALTIDND
jgi:hypothetical protein